MHELKKGIRLFVSHFFPAKLIAVFSLIWGAFVFLGIANDTDVSKNEIIMISFAGTAFLSCMSGISAAASASLLKSAVYASSQYSKTGITAAPVIVYGFLNTVTVLVFMICELFKRNVTFFECLSDTAVLSILLSTLLVNGILIAFGKYYSVFYYSFIAFMTDDIIDALEKIPAPALIVSAVFIAAASVIFSFKLSHYFYRNDSCRKTGELYFREEKKKNERRRKEEPDECGKPDFSDRTELLSGNNCLYIKGHIIVPAVCALLIVLTNIIGDNKLITLISGAAIMLTAMYSILSLSRLVNLPSVLNKSGYLPIQKMIMTTPLFRQNMLKFTLTVIAENIVLVFGIPFILTVISSFCNIERLSEIRHICIFIFTAGSLYVPCRHLARKDIAWGLHVIFTFILLIFSVPVRMAESAEIIGAVLAAGIILYAFDISYTVYETTKKRNSSSVYNS